MNTLGKRCCAECGEPVGASNRYDKKFCSTVCGSAWNNRRKQRGADLYDLVMNICCDRKAARAVKAISLMWRMAANWRDEDRARGLKSYASLDEVMTRHVSHVATKHASRGRKVTTT